MCDLLERRQRTAEQRWAGPRLEIRTMCRTWASAVMHGR